MDNALVNENRNFIPPSFTLSKIEDLAPYIETLRNAEFRNLDDLEAWLIKLSEFEGFISEHVAWRYINYTRFTDNDEYKNHYLDFVQNIQPELVKIENELNKKFVNNPFFASLSDDLLVNYKKKARLAIELYREENIELETKQSTLAQEYAAIIGAMQIEHNGKEFTLPQASKLLLETDRNLRKSVYEKIQNVRFENRDKLNDILNDLIELRNKQALNTGFENYRDYKHKSMGRFDYSVNDVLKFHDAVKNATIPITKELQDKRKDALELDTLKPYDTSVNIYSNKPLRPFETGNELLSKSIKAFKDLHPVFGNTLKTMKELGFLDLESRKGKAPGGYNYPLDEHGVPFIFMNASGAMRDVTTMVHEGGHAVHSIVTKDLPYNGVKHCPSEVSELASMSMELISMDTWHHYFDDQKDLVRAKIEQLEGVLDVLPWIATIDKYQHWLYTNPEHNVTEREIKWVEIYEEFNGTFIDFSGYEKFKNIMWQKQLHIFEVPFYYIEYGIAQLGAIAIWKNYKDNSTKALDQYISALKLGYTKPIPEIYETAGIKFDFSEKYITELLDFVKTELNSLIDTFRSL